MLLIIVQIILIILGLYCVFLFFRNNAVLKFRSYVSDLMFLCFREEAIITHINITEKLNSGD